MSKNVVTEMGDPDLTQLTQGEKLVLWRRRQPSVSGATTGNGAGCLNQRDAAARLGVLQSVYWKAERDRAEQRIMLALLERTKPHRPPTIGELCLIARRRSGMFLSTIEAALGISRPILMRMEAQADKRLMTFWRQHGFQFTEADVMSSPAAHSPQPDVEPMDEKISA